MDQADLPLAEDIPLDGVRKGPRGLGWVPTAVTGWMAMKSGLEPFFREDYAAHIQGYSPILAALDRLPLAQRIAQRDHLNQALYISAKTSLPKVKQAQVKQPHLASVSSLA